MAAELYDAFFDRYYIVCGEVDVRAGQGGFDALTLYIAAFAPDEKTFKLGTIEGSGDTTSSVIRQCREAGIAL
jgi:hypothetical protein